MEKSSTVRKRVSEHLGGGSPLIELRDLTKWFPLSVGFFSTVFRKKELFVHAVDEVSFDIKKGEIFVLAGETGCGKTTTGMLIVRLIEPTSGQILLKGKDIAPIPPREFKPYRRKMQIIFQDPYESLNPRQSVEDTIGEPLRLHHLVESRQEEREKVIEMLKLVKLIPPEQFMSRYPHQLSGGQRQRVAVARAMVLDPEFIVADEPVSMLDVSIRAGLLNFFLEIRKKFGVTLLFITHDLAVASYLADRIAIMYLGKIVEMGPVEKIVNNPLNPYTQALIASVPSPDPTKEKRRVSLKGEPPSPINPPPGCRFHTRCPYAKNICREEEPILEAVGNGRLVACHFWNRFLE